MKKQSTVVLCLAVLIILLAASGFAQKQKGNEYACVEPNAASLCTPANTCGAACSVEIQKEDKGSTVTPNISGAKKNKLFCVKSGTKVTFESKRKNTGFVLDFGPSSPFDREDSIIGGTNKPDTAVASKPGCYRFSAGACVSGAIYGMCGNSMAEIVVTK